tara:strand:- start:5170 stop:5403 length:234 start_codon:yes stop_codon:yes gene_type:complete
MEDVLDRQNTVAQADAAIRQLAEEQVVFLKNRYGMGAADIIALYGGKSLGSANFTDAIEHIAVFNMETALKNGFIAS